jgi:glycosyltransferase involved in cell wall biosynthesis
MSDLEVHPRVTMLVRNPFTHDTRVENEARTLAEAGYRVTVIAEARPELPARELVGGVSIWRVPRPAVRLPGLRYIAYRQRLVRALTASAPQLLHAHDSDALEPVATVAGRLGVPFVYDAHELWLSRLPRGRNPLYVQASRIAYGLIERRLLSRAAGWITVSPPIARLLEKRYRLSRVRLVANYPHLPSRVRRRELRGLSGMAGVPAAQPLVLYVGALLPGRGIEQLIEAMGDVDATLVILGEGQQRPALEALAAERSLADRVRFAGVVPSADVIGFAASADVGVSPIVPISLSYAYSLPNKLFQYMAAGLPIVASDFPQVREVVERSGAGVVVDARRPVEIAQALNRVLRDPEEARRMGRRGRRAARQRYHWGVSAQELLGLYEAVLPVGAVQRSAAQEHSS